MSLKSARGNTKDALQKRRDARTLEPHNPSRAKKLHKAATAAGKRATTAQENVRGRAKKKKK